MASPPPKPPLQPFAVPRPIVAPQREAEFHLGDSERALFDTWAQEQTRIAGTTFEYYSISVQKSEKDPLYNETTQRVFLGPFRVPGWLEVPIATPEMQEEGIHKVFAPKAWISRKEMEDQRMNAPMYGDVLRAWTLPFYNQWSTVESEPIKGAGYYFDVVGVNTDGQLFDSASFVGFILNLKRRTEFTPERRIDSI